MYGLDRIPNLLVYNKNEVVFSSGGRCVIFASAMVNRSVAQRLRGAAGGLSM